MKYLHHYIVTELSDPGHHRWEKSPLLLPVSKSFSIYFYPLLVQFLQSQHCCGTARAHLDLGQRFLTYGSRPKVGSPVYFCWVPKIFCKTKFLNIILFFCNNLQKQGSCIKYQVIVLYCLASNTCLYYVHVQTLLNKCVGIHV